ncbi:MAG: hypothetical protein PHS92_02270 [Candidatus Gracilibacteria bacterium]|nr:hypothetical protein [Candidatus Gracilibacteria bacterium]
MKKSDANEKDKIEDIIEEIEVIEEKPKPVLPKVPVQKAGPIFPNANRFGRGMQGSSTNNRQRPGRAAGRGR